jgi:sugar phosphate isomerase/epimerase
MDNEGQTRRRFLEASGVGALSLTGAVALGQDGPEQRKPPLKLGLPTYMFKHYDLDQTIAMAKRVAVDHICLRSNLLPLSSTPEQITAAITKVKDTGLTIYGGGVIYMRNDAAVSRAFDYSEAAGFRLISISILPELLPLLERKVKEFDIRAAIHNHGPEDRHWPTPVAIYEKVEGLDKRIGICHDTGHTQRAGMDPTEATLKTADRLMDVHLKDVDAAAAKGHSVELGRGVVDLPRFLRTLVKAGYGGVVGIEYEKHLKDLLPGLAECVGYARGALAAIRSGA